MPPFIPHKCRLSTSPLPDSSIPKSRKKRKPSLFDAADKPSTSASLQDNKSFLDQLHDSESESSLTDVSSEELEDVTSPPSHKKRKINHQDEEDDEINWEDAIPTTERPHAHLEPSGDLQLTLDKNAGTVNSLANSSGKKRGPSKIERQIRVATHCMHVQFLLFHNLTRNGWVCDKEVQSILLEHIPANVKKEVEKWKVASGIKHSPSSETQKSSARNGRKGRKTAQERNQRDWGKPAERQEPGAPNMSRGDPLIKLLKILAAYWKKRWTVTAPSLRKQGYRSLATLEEEIASYRDDKHNPEEHGERVRNIREFRETAKKCEGSRDIGAQLFTALIRGLGLEARLVASLQPVGFGWSKSEEISVKRKRVSERVELNGSEAFSSEEESNLDVKTPLGKVAKIYKQPTGKARRTKGAKEAPINLSGEAGDDSMEGDDVETEDDASVVDVTPATPRKRPNMNYDRDLLFPTYWTEVISPITNEVYPVDPLVLTPAVAANPEQLTLFESRGAKADKAKQVFAYVVGYSPDGSAKEVTTRYLKRHMWPGRTKGVRMPAEKIPIHDKKGKIKHYEEFDWFKTVMSGYRRTDAMRTVVDDLEEAKDLKAAKPEQKETKASEETLQGYKISAQFVLERHLRREEALRPGSRPVKTFNTGKGDKVKEEAVYLRKDVEVCRTGESWHKEGRGIKSGEVPMKMVPVRAVTLTRKREVEEAKRATGEKLKQGLYAISQTDWITPPPIEDGIIPKNAFGNIDAFVPQMIPQGAVHIPLRSTVKICKRLGIDYAEAVTGFEFGNKMAVPVITGVVVAEENENNLIDEWEKDEEERRIKEEGKREKAALATWRKWLMGLRIIQRVREEYGGDADAHMKEEMNPFTNQRKAKKAPQADAEPGSVHEGRAVDEGEDHVGGGFIADDGMKGGGFLPNGYDEKKVPRSQVELVIEDEKTPTQRSSYWGPTPSEFASLSSSHERGSEHSGVDDDDEPQVKQKGKSKPIENGTASKKSKSKLEKTPALKIPARNGRKRRASPSLSGSDYDNPMNAPEEQSPPRKATTRAAPKRTAARKSETAVKSHYFDHDSDDEDGKSNNGNSTSEDDVTEKPAVMKKKKRGASTKSRSRRARKSM